jgi:hypothetical protein
MVVEPWATAKKTAPAHKTKHTHSIIVMPQQNATAAAEYNSSSKGKGVPSNHTTGAHRDVQLTFGTLSSMDFYLFWFWWRGKNEILLGIISLFLVNTLVK